MIFFHLSSLFHLLLRRLACKDLVTVVIAKTCTSQHVMCISQTYIQSISYRAACVNIQSSACLV